MRRLISLLVTLYAAASFAGCGAMHDYYNMAMAKRLKAEPVEDTPAEPETPVTPSPLFSFGLGNPVTPVQVADQDLLNDYDGDTIPNSQETTTNPFVAEYPKIVTRIDTPISVEIRSESSDSDESFTETVSGSETKDTLSNSMESKQYAQANKKTTPYVTKEAYSDSVSNSKSWGSSVSDAESSSSKVAGSVSLPRSILGGGGSASMDIESSASDSHSESNNGSLANSLAESTSSEKTVFQDVDYVDNLDRNGVEINSNKVQTMTSSFRSSKTSKTTTTIGPNAGIVSSCLRIHNLSVNYPVHISNVKCTLSFRTPSGQCQAVRTFTLRNDDYSVFSEDVYGDEEKGPYAVVIDGLNTDFVKKALSNGWVPQIHVVSYTTSKVKDSNYDPGVDNLKIVEEKAKGRTAFISIKGQGLKESFRVSAFDVQNGFIVPGISLKKALFNIMADRIGSGEKWTSDKNGAGLTVEDANLKWMKGNTSGIHNYSSNYTGNSWRSFESYVKTYTDDSGKAGRIETVKRLYTLKKFNPFDIKDNANYNPSELLPVEQMNKMQVWVIYHDGKYFEGDINDPIWPGERYELVCVDVQDFNEHFSDYYFTPLQSMDPFSLNTRWNALSNSDPYSRSVFLGQVVKGDVVHLQVKLDQTNDLFLNGLSASRPSAVLEPPYTCGTTAIEPNGVPKSFSHSVKGDTNSFVVAIEESENAQSYDIEITGQTLRKKISKKYSELDLNGGVVFIDRTTICSDDQKVGFIPGGEYVVKVFAKGTAYGAEVRIASTTNNNSGVVSVSNASSSPAPFSATAYGYHDKMIVGLTRGTGTEYYSATISGPLNTRYAASRQDVPKEFHSGYNIIEIETPPADIADEPGVYKITVVAQNSRAASAVSPVVSETYTTIVYDKYAAQKDLDTRPKISTALEMLGAVDLEMNFNDGNGWFAVQTSGVDAELINQKKIDCRYTGFVDFKSQIFDVYVYPPAGPKGANPSPYNIFSGGREVADVYVRTRAKPEYRDTLWPRAGKAGLSSSSALSPFDMINRVLSSEAFDATKAESPSLYGDASAPVYISNADKSNIFFAPKKERTYTVTASLTSEDSTVNNLSDPPAKPTAIVETYPYNSIRVREITGGDRTKDIAVYYKNGTYSADEDISLYWSQALTPAADNPDPNGYGNYVEIKNLVKNQTYTIAVRGIGENGKYSDPLLFEKIPYGQVAQSPPMFTAAAQSVNRNQVLVSNLYLPGESRYQVWYKINNGISDSENSTWTLGLDTFDKWKVPSLNPVSYLFESLTHSTAYMFKARAVSLTYGSDGNTDAGPWTPVVEVMTLAPVNAKPFVSVTVPGDSTTKVCVSLLGGQAYEVAYKEQKDGDTTDPDAWGIDLIKESAPLSLAYSKVYGNLKSWTRYTFAARTVDFYTGDPGVWSETYLVNTGIPSAVYTRNEATLDCLTFSNTNGIANVVTSPFELADIDSYGIFFYVSYEYSFVPILYGGAIGSLTAGTGRAVYSADTLKTYGDITIPRISGEEFLTVPLFENSPEHSDTRIWNLSGLLSSIAGTYANNNGLSYSDPAFKSLIAGVKFIFHSKYAGVDDIVVVQGKTW